MAHAEGRGRVRNGSVAKLSPSFHIPLCLVLVHLCLLDFGFGFYTSECSGPLGMESMEIRDGDLSASSSFDAGNVGPQNARVRVERQGGAWCPKNQVTSDAEEWIEVDLHTVHVITGTETQGRFGNGQGAEFAEFYIISYWRPELGRWIRYKDNTGNEILTANINTYTPAKVEFKTPIFASKLRFHPFAHHGRTACMRVEIYGCPFRGGLVSYQMSQGNKRGELWTFHDQSYDGTFQGGLLQNGLGQLVDGRGGPHDFKEDFYTERGKSWVGWKNDSKTNENNPIEIVFKFETVREFNTIHIHTSNQFTKEVQVFQEARVSFSIGGQLYNEESISYFPMEDCIFEDPKNITIKLHHRFGRFIKIQLYWAAKWILISEVTFDSQPAIGTFTDESITTPSILPTAGPAEEENALVAQRDTLDGFQIAIPPLSSEKENAALLPESEWSSGAIIMTAIVSSFAAILLVLLVLLAALLLRSKLRRQKKRPGGNHGTLPYDAQTEFGYMAPPPVGKWQITAPEYEEPFTPSKTKSQLASFSAVNQSGTAVFCGGREDKMVECYSSSLISTSTPPNVTDSSNEYEYAVPNELGKLLPQTQSSMKRVPNSPAPGQMLPLQSGLRQLGIPEIPKHQLRILRRLGDGAFGSDFIGELTTGRGVTRLVIVKNLMKNSTEKDKSDFFEEIFHLVTTEDSNAEQILGVCTEEEPFCVLIECHDLRPNDYIPSNARQFVSDNWDLPRRNHYEFNPISASPITFNNSQHSPLKKQCNIKESKNEKR